LGRVCGGNVRFTMSEFFPGIGFMTVLFEILFKMLFPKAGAEQAAGRCHLFFATH